METRKALAVIILLLALAMPTALAEIDGHENGTFESLTALVIDGEQEMTGRDAIHLRTGIDAYGDANGHVSAPEVTAFESAYETFVKEHSNEYTLNGVEGTFVNMVVTFKDAEGSVNSTVPLTYEYQGRIDFSGVGADLDLYTFRIVNEGGDLNSTMTVRVSVPRGYAITATEGIHAPEFSRSDSTVSGQTLTDSNVLIAFGPADEFAWLYWPLLISGLISAVIVAAWAVTAHRGGREEFRPAEEETPDQSEGNAPESGGPG